MFREIESVLHRLSQFRTILVTLVLLSLSCLAVFVLNKQLRPSINQSMTEKPCKKTHGTSQIRDFDYLNDMVKRSIYFLEVNDELVEFQGRLLCAFESAAKHNTGSQVYVILSKNSKLSEIPEYFLNITNIQYVKINFDALLLGTRVQSLWKEGNVTNSTFSMNNVSDLLRIVIALRFGGTYMDTDVISIRAIPDATNGLIVAESENVIGNAVFSFSKGHIFLKKALQIIAHDFHGNIWGYQGPTLFTNLAKELCNKTRGNELIFTRKCENLTILPPNVAFANRYENWRDLFDETKTKIVKTLIKHSFAVHYWNYMIKSAREGIKIRKTHPLYTLFVENCPLTVKQVLRKELGKLY